MRIIFRICIFL